MDDRISSFRITTSPDVTCQQEGLAKPHGSSTSHVVPASITRLVCALAIVLVTVPLQAQDRIGPAPYTVLIVGQMADLTTTLESLHSGRGKEGNALWSSAGTVGFVVIKTSSALAMGLAMRQLASHGHPRAAKVLGYSAGFALMGVGISNARVGR